MRSGGDACSPESSRNSGSNAPRSMLPAGSQARLRACHAVIKRRQKPHDFTARQGNALTQAGSPAVDSFVPTHVALRVPQSRDLSRAPLRSGICLRAVSPRLRCAHSCLSWIKVRPPSSTSPPATNNAPPPTRYSSFFPAIFLLLAAGNAAVILTPPHFNLGADQAREVWAL